MEEDGPLSLLFDTCKCSEVRADRASFCLSAIAQLLYDFTISPTDPG
jgi:hypothetical protein